MSRRDHRLCRPVEKRLKNNRMTTPYGPPKGQPQAAGGRLIVNSSYNWMSFLLGLTGTKIEIDDRPYEAKWGQWPIDLPAGDHQVRVSTRYAGEFGPARTVVTIQPGTQTTVYYRAPAMMFTAGAIGLTPQRTRGLATVLVLVAVLCILVVLMTLS